MRRALALAIAALAAASCHRGAGEAEAPRSVEVHCLAPKPTAIDETLLLRGRLEPPPGGDLPVASQVAGRVDSLAVHEGQRVAAGDEIAFVDDQPSRDSARQADAAVTQAKAASENAKATLARIELLVQKGIAAKQELDDARARADAAKASVSSAIAASNSAHLTLRRVSVRSSFAGVITRIFRGPGAIVDGTAQTPIAQLAAEGGVELVADVTERDLLRLAPAQPAIVTFPAGSPQATGTVRTRASALDPTTGLGVVRIGVDHTDAPIGAFGRAIVTVAHRKDVPLLPVSALRRPVGDGAEVVRCDPDGKAEVVPVEVGWRDDVSVEIRSGLGPHDRVAVDHVLGLETGTPIAEAK
jgi:RND family efflux transporter MFP subunit